MPPTTAVVGAVIGTADPAITVEPNGATWLTPSTVSAIPDGLLANVRLATFGWRVTVAGADATPNESVATSWITSDDGYS